MDPLVDASDELNNSISMWSQCSHCLECTHVSSLSCQSWNYSFGKYLDILFNNPKFTPPKFCPHFKDYSNSIIRCFRYKNTILYFKKSLLQLYEIRGTSSLKNDISGKEPSNHLTLSDIYDFFKLKSFANQNNQDKSIQRQSSCLNNSLSKVKYKLCSEISLFYNTLTNYISHLKQFETYPKILMMLCDMEFILNQELQFLLASVEKSQFHMLNTLRLKFIAQIDRELLNFKTWQNEFAPRFVYNLDPVIPDYYLKMSIKSCTLFPDHGIILKSTEPHTLISFTLLSKDYENIKLKNETFNSDWKIIQNTFQSKVSFFTHDQYIPDAHFKFKFKTTSDFFSCTVYFWREFEALRKQFGVNDTFGYSLVDCTEWSTSGGKSKAMFYKSSDDKLIIKQLACKWSLVEKDELLKFTPHYCNYIKDRNGKATILAKIFGFYTVKYKNTQGMLMHMDFIVMENLFNDSDISRRFDLKGIPDRHTPFKEKNENSTGLDRDWLHGRYETLFRIDSKSKNMIQDAVLNDTLFLQECNIMDYSLLVGINEKSKQLIVGIVDYLGPYNWYKKMEQRGKATLNQTFGMGVNNITILEPEKYRNRFRNAIDQYFVMVPDKFTNLN